METGEEPNPCIECGACCAYYRASFYWAEADEGLQILDDVFAFVTENIDYR